MGFVDSPIITSPFDVPTFHYELDDAGQPTGAKLKDRRDTAAIRGTWTSSRMPTFSAK